MTAKIARARGIGKIETGVKGAGKKAADSPLMEALTRLGYGVRGLIYIMMGLLALNVTIGNGGAPAGQQGAIDALGRQPAGLVFLWVIVAGLASYALWGVIRAVLDPLKKGHDLKGLVLRAGFLVSAVSYALLILPTYASITGAGRPAQGGTLSMASIMSMPWGRWAIGLVGLVIIAIGLVQIYQGIKTSFDRQFQTYAMTAQQVKLAMQLGRFGTASRGFVLALVGGLVCLAAFQSNPSQPIGVDAALTTLMHQPYGILLLGIVAFGLMAFGAYSMLSAAWFRSKR